jgi:hypothetical protein
MKSLISAHPLNPTQIVSIVTVCIDNDGTIATSNFSLEASAQHVMSAQPASRPSLVATSTHLFGAPTPQYFNVIIIATLQAIADTGATSIFITEGTPVKNIRPAMGQMTIN